MKKIILGLTVFVVFIGIMAYVILGNLKGSTSIGGKAVLTYWGLFEDEKTMNTIISDFEKDNPI